MWWTGISWERGRLARPARSGPEARAPSASRHVAQRSGAPTRTLRAGHVHLREADL